MLLPRTTPKTSAAGEEGKSPLTHLLLIVCVRACVTAKHSKVAMAQVPPRARVFAVNVTVVSSVRYLDCARSAPATCCDMQLGRNENVCGAVQRSRLRAVCRRPAGVPADRQTDRQESGGLAGDAAEGDRGEHIGTGLTGFPGNLGYLACTELLQVWLTFQSSALQMHLPVDVFAQPPVGGALLRKPLEVHCGSLQDEFKMR